MKEKIETFIWGALALFVWGFFYPEFSLVGGTIQLVNQSGEIVAIDENWDAYEFLNNQGKDTPVQYKSLLVEIMRVQEKHSQVK